jgi:hypothetical protein
MKLSQRNEWIAVGVLIAYIAFVPTFAVVKDFLKSAVGKAVGLAAIVYAWKYVSEPVALLLLVAILATGAIREFADDPSMKPDSAVYHCEAGFDLDSKTKQCKKGSEVKAAIQCSASETWDAEKSTCKSKSAGPPASAKLAAPSGGAPGPSTGTTGSAAAQAALAAAPKTSTAEHFSPYEKSTCGAAL